jgi:tRNA (cmo5U34)-methyltransferase
MRETGSPPEKLEKIRETHGRDVAVLPATHVAAMITDAGFEAPVQFLQTVLIHAWYTRRIQPAA